MHLCFSIAPLSLLEFFMWRRPCAFRPGHAVTDIMANINSTDRERDENERTTTFTPGNDSFDARHHFNAEHVHLLLNRCTGAPDFAGSIFMECLVQLNPVLRIRGPLPCQSFYLFLRLLWYERPNNLQRVGKRYPSPIHCVLDAHAYTVDVLFPRTTIHYLWRLAY